ncbi:MAG: glycosyltransferase family 2 protein [Fischerella sp. CENA71]|nr:glycosyltransferase family 2 protein [Fischerella sp. CENA71]
MPKVSVIIPAYNAMTYLPETVGSVLRQSFTDFEVLIIDDGSSDTIQQWASQVQDPRLRLISQENQGASAARNNGIAHAQGEYLAFLDADDLWEATKLEKQVLCLENYSAAGLVYTWTAFIDPTGKPTGRVFASKAEGDVWNQLIEHNIIECGSSPMIRRDCFAAVGLFDCNLLAVEDWEMWVRIASRYPFALLKEPLTYYRQLSTSLSKNWQLMAQCFPLFIEKVFDSAPAERLYLKNHSYYQANLCLAWKCLQSTDRDYKQAILFRQQAIIHYPQKRYSLEYLRLSLAITLMRYLGSDGYNQVMEIIYALRRRALGRLAVTQ